MVSTTAYAAIAIAIVIPLAIFAVYSTSIESEPIDSMDSDDVDNAEPKIFVLSSFYPIGQFVSNVGGDKIRSELVLPPGAEPHDWEPTVKDVQNMKNADAIVINGVGFESWVESLHDVGFQGILIDTSKNIPIMEAIEGHGDHGDEREEEDHGDEREEEDHGDEREEDDDDHAREEEEEDHGDEREEDDDDHAREEEEEDDHHDSSLGDPHIWLSPVHAQTQVQNIADGLSLADAKNADYYQNNAAEYIAELQQLDSDIRTSLESCSREFIAFHQAFTYFSAEYDLVQHTILKAATPHGEVAPRTLQLVIETAKQQNIDTIFSEDTADPRVAQVVADEINGRVLLLSPLEVGQPGQTYISSMYGNLESLKAALCQDQ